MVLALVVAVIVAVTAVALAVVRHRQLGAARAELARTESAVTALTGERDALERAHEALEGSVRSLGETLEERSAALDTASARASALEASLRGAETATAERSAALDAAVAEVTLLEARLAEARRAPAPQALEDRVAHACWALLIARVERQWAAGVAARPDERGVAERPGDQLVEAIGRELERLREEVGVHAEAVAAAPFLGDPLVALLVVGEALAVLAPDAERLRVEIAEVLVVIGDDWSGPAEALVRLRDVVSRTGYLRRLEEDAGHVSLVVGAPPATSPEGE